VWGWGILPKGRPVRRSKRRKEWEEKLLTPVRNEIADCGGGRVSSPDKAPRQRNSCKGAWKKGENRRGQSDHLKILSAVPPKDMKKLWLDVDGRGLEVRRGILKDLLNDKVKGGVSKSTALVEGGESRDQPRPN